MRDESTTQPTPDEYLQQFSRTTCPAPMPIPPLSDEQIVQVWSRIDSSGGPDACWPWVGTSGIPWKTYGTMTIDGRNYRATRIVKHLTAGPFDESLYVCHACDNPPCCNPAHLWLGTARDNLRDALKKNRRDPTSKFTSEQIMSMLLENLKLSRTPGWRWDTEGIKITTCQRSVGGLG